MNSPNTRTSPWDVPMAIKEETALKNNIFEKMNAKKKSLSKLDLFF